MIQNHTKRRRRTPLGTGPTQTTIEANRALVALSLANELSMSLAVFSAAARDKTSDPASIDYLKQDIARVQVLLNDALTNVVQ
jgi:hypothetical protein